jgi:ubiquinone/menaquinone biosynthesis C-methylase UbiE
MSNEYKPHMLEWTDEKVARFWNFRNNYPAYNDTWFTHQVGKALLSFVNKKIPVKGKVLDYGTGKGFLVSYLLDHYSKAAVYACDFTDSLVTETQQRFEPRQNFKGAAKLEHLPSAYAENFFDLVFLIETIEHLTDDYLTSTLAEINRILVPGGTVIITTPNEEQLEKTHVHCADCGATFHHMQHLRSWNSQSLAAHASRFGFATVFCKGINIQWHQKAGMLHFLSDQVKAVFAKPKKPNLIYIGKKKK